MLTLRNISHVYGQGASAHHAIDNISFDVDPKSFVTIVGPSGAGKTTLIRIMAGLQGATEGKVEIDGQEVAGVPDGLAMVFQDYSRSLLPWLTVEKNVMFPLHKRSISAKERKDRARSSLKVVGLGDGGVGKRYPGQLSGGMQQRVAIARAIAYQPRIMLMDEPFASVDAQSRGELEDLVLRLKEELGITVVFITHDIDESVYVADRVLVLSKAPARLIGDLPVDLPSPRNQITTKADPTFVERRAKVASLILTDPSDAEDPVAVESSEVNPT